MDNTEDNVDSDKMMIQKLLEEIQLLKNKINELEQKQDNSIHQTVLEKSNYDSLHFVNWISDYVQGTGHNKGKFSGSSIPVNALNEPNSHTNTSHSLALGKQGQVTLGFSEPVGGKLIVYEAGSYPFCIGVCDLSTLKNAYFSKKSDWRIY